MDKVDMFAYLGGFFLMISFLPQVIRSVRTRKTDDISLLLLCFTLVSGVFYELYAYFLSLTPVIIMNGLFLLLVSAQLIITLKYRTQSKKQSASKDRLD